jgi:adenine-specific DNA-methyltransferase
MPRPKKQTTLKKLQVSKTGSSQQDITETYRHPTAESLMRPEVGTQAQFRKKKPPVIYRYDSSLSPALEWDGQNPARERGETLIAKLYDVTAALSGLWTKIKGAETEEERAKIQAEIDKAQATVSSIADGLKALGKPFLNWAGKAERLSFDVPTLPLFVHERLSTKAIIETLASHKKDKQLDFDLFGDPHHSITDQILKAYEYKDKWVNRLVLGDSLVVMNSLVHYEGLGGQVQMIYMDPPYGVKFGSNFQPFVRKRDVKHNEDDDMTREPEMVKAYRDTWELGLHSYLTYMRDRLLIARELLTPSGSIFVQIGDENVHHVREILDELYGSENFVSLITFRKKGMPLGAKYLEGTVDYLLWYARDKQQMKYRQLFVDKSVQGDSHWDRVELLDGSRRKMTTEEIKDHSLLPDGSTVYQLHQLYPAGLNTSGVFDFIHAGRTFRPPTGRSWKTNLDGMKRLSEAKRVEPYEDGRTLRYVLKLSDYPVTPINNLWSDLGSATGTIYVVQTNVEVIKRCILLTTDPGELVLDPTCGSGTTAYVAEQWGRRWITIDTSRVPLALARQRLLTATFPYYQLKETELGPAGGFVYSRKKNKKGEDIGGIVPHIKLENIAHTEPPSEEVLVDRPEVINNITRVTGPFCLEATIPTPVDWEGDGVEDSGAPEAMEYGSFVDRMLEVLRRSPVLHLDGGKTVEFKGIRKPAKTLSLSAEAVVDATANGMKPTLQDAVAESMEKNTNALPLSQKSVAILFGPENGAISEKLVYEAAREAHAKNYAHLFVIGFAIQPGARNLIDNCEAAVGVPATYVQATPDLLMGDLLKNMRSSQIFSVCGLPEIRLTRVGAGLVPAHNTNDKDRATTRVAPTTPQMYQIELIGLDVFDPVTMDVDHRKGDDVPAWFLDADYNGLCFHVSQAFFPRTSAWDNLKRALKSTHEESVWDHLAGTVSAPFEPGEHGQIAVKVIDDRGNELLVVKSLREIKG